MKTFHIFVLAIFIPVYCVAQQPIPQYDRLISEAENHMRQSQYAEALEKYTNALAISETPFYHMYNAACAAAHAGETDQAFNLLFRRLAADKDWHSENITHDKDLISLHSDERWPALTDSLKNRMERYESRYDRQLRNQLKTILKEDQDIRQEYIAAQANGASSEIIDSLIMRMQQIDSVNQYKIAALLDQYGWLDSSKVGDAASIQFYVLQHAPLQIQIKYRKQIRKGLKLKDIEAYQYAMFEDRIAVQSGKKQKYGTQILYTDTGKPYVAPCVNNKNVNKLRHKVGLPPMNQYLKRWGLEWPYN